MTRRDSFPVAALLLLTFTALGGIPLAAAPQNKPQDELPADETKLFEYAQGRMSHERWRDSDRAFKAFLEKFPKGKQAEQAHLLLAQLHQWHSGRRAEGREWLGKLCENFPKSPNYWNYRFQLAQAWQYEDRRQQAIEEYEKIAKEAPDAGVRASAIQQIWGVKGKYFRLNVNQTFTAGQQPTVHVNLRQIDKVAYRAFHIKYDALLAHLGGAESPGIRQAIAKVGKEGRRPVKEWTAEYTYAKNNEWKQENVAIPSTESGVYILEGEHEGVTMTVTLVVTKYGLVTKAAAGKIVCFAQDRATSKPVEGMEIRLLREGKPAKGVTDASGLFVADRYAGGVVVGIKDGEVVSTEAWAGGGQGEHPLIYFSTDRPIYRPNQAVHFRLVHRIEKGLALERRPGTKLAIEIRDPKGNKIYDQVHALNEFGSTEGRIVLGDEPPLGEYKLFARGEKDDPNLHQHDWQWVDYWGPGPHPFGKFRVDEYRKPEYKVDVEFKRSPVLQGEMVEASIKADYYFGSPVVDAEVQYTVYRRGHWWMWRNWAYYYDWYQEDEEEFHGKHARRWWGHGEKVTQGAGRTDKDGRLALAFTAQKWDHDAVYTVVAKVTDLSRRQVEGTGTCKATRAEFGLAMTLNKYVYKPGERINARVRAATADDKVVADAKITLKGYERRWANGKHEDLPLFEGAARTDEHGIAEFNLSPEREGGYLYLVAEAHDRKDNRVTAEHYAWLCGSNWAGDHVNLNGVDLILDKKTYERGETAQVLVTSQHKNVTLLFTVEGREIQHHEVVSVKGHTKVVDLKIDRAAYAPNVYVTVAAIKENQLVERRKMLIVNPSDKFVSVEVKPDKAQYRPRQKARYEVTTKGADGKPVAAEVALGIVDDSIYALQDEYAADIRKHFIHRRANEVGTSCSLYYYDYGHAELREENEKLAAEPAATAAPAAQGKDAARERGAAKGEAKNGGNKLKQQGGGQAYAATEIRSNFADTMAWRTVTTGADGLAVVEIDLPDNLTTWKATARAVTADSRFGQQEGSVVCRKEMIVRLETPRFFTQNDVTTVSAVAHNYLKGEKEVKIEFSAEGIEVEGEKEMKVRIAPEGQKRIDWKARVRRPGTARITVKALSDEDSDAMRLDIPVLAHGAPKWDSRAGLVDGRVVEKIVIPEGAAKEAAELVVVVSPTHAAMVLDALEYLAGYPYGCVEQTMSRFLPTVIVGQALQKLGIQKPELQKELPHMVAQGLQRLYNFQQQDGGWGWWQNDKSNPWTTAYVVFGLAMAREADFQVDPNCLQKGIHAAINHLAQAKEADVQAYLLHSLSVAGIRQDVVRDRLTDRLGELKPYSKALLSLVLAKDGRKAKEVTDALAKDAKVVGGSVHFEGGTRGGWMDHDMEVTAACLRAFLKVDPKHELVPRMVHWLSTVRQGNYWGSTKQTAMVVFSLVDYLAQTGDLNPDMTLSLSLNGERIFSERVTKANWHSFEGMRKFPSARLKAGENEVVIEKQGSGTPIYSVYAKTYTLEENLQPSKGGIQVERTFSRVRNIAGKRVLEILESGAEVTSGDEIEVTVAVTADRDYEWLMLEDPLPSGFEAVREYWGHYGWHWNYWYSRKEFRDEKVSIAMTTLGRGRNTASYVMRAETPGDLHVLPSAVFNMYHPEIGGNSGEFRIRVKDK